MIKFEGHDFKIWRNTTNLIHIGSNTLGDEKQKCLNAWGVCTRESQELSHNLGMPPQLPNGL